MADQLDSVRKHLPALRDLLQQLNPEQRGEANNFWRAIRNALTDLDNEVEQLRSTVSSLTAGPPATRPATTESVIGIRNVVDAAILSDSLYAEDASTTIEEIADQPWQWADAFLRRYKNNQVHELGCWESNSAAGHDTGYVKINLRNTENPLYPGVKFRCQPWVHQVGIVAKQEGHLLRLTSDGQHQVCSKTTLY